MKHQKILNLLNEWNDSKFVKRKWNIVNGQSDRNYDARTEIIYNTELLKSNLCDYNDAYILVRGNLTIVRDKGTKVAFQTCTSFIKCITKIDGTIIVDYEDIDLVMPVNNLLEYSSNYSDVTVTL